MLRYRPSSTGPRKSIFQPTLTGFATQKVKSRFTAIALTSGCTWSRPTSHTLLPTETTTRVCCLANGVKDTDQARLRVLSCGIKHSSSSSESYVRVKAYLSTLSPHRSCPSIKTPASFITSTQKSVSENYDILHARILDPLHFLPQLSKTRTLFATSNPLYIYH